MSTMRSKVIRVWDVLDAGETACRVYERVLARPTSLEVANNMICLLLWLETIAGVHILEDVPAMEGSGITLSQLVIEADALYNYLLHGQEALPEPLVGIPAIEALCNSGRLVDFRLFKFHRDLVARGVTVIRDTIAEVVFSDHLHMMLRRFEDEVHSSTSVTTSVPAPELIAPFVAITRTPPEDSRTAFVAFWEGHPLSSQDIINYFEQVRRCIERVETEQPCAGQTPKHAVIVFSSAELREQVMFNETAVYYRVNGYDMWVQAYKPRL
ncbi:hypothetical protein GQ55_9G399200 [Panicum hallii var. hallii]|uniref:Uncharacterized protein n=1 Tax=Panicum hallii var. hallii TaxID=1504633 RepID=A0A2T7CA37_9POAL|nr:hypothetical protein GQ55_9G399200 [Panicum hallii var. hallii]